MSKVIDVKLNRDDECGGRIAEALQILVLCALICVPCTSIFNIFCTFIPWCFVILYFTYFVPYFHCVRPCTLLPFTCSFFDDAYPRQRTVGFIERACWQLWNQIIGCFLRQGGRSFYMPNIFLTWTSIHWLMNIVRMCMMRVWYVQNVSITFYYSILL